MKELLDEEGAIIIRPLARPMVRQIRTLDRYRTRLATLMGLAPALLPWNRP